MSWLHTDQSKQTAAREHTRNGWNCIQSGINLEDTCVGDGSFRVLSGSHLLHAEAPWVGDKKNWYKLSGEEVKWYMDKGCTDLSITCTKGSMVLWDSRAIHASTNVMKGREFPRFRYTCFFLQDTSRPLGQ